MKIAIVHDYLVQYGGAERVLESFCELFPHAPIYTLVYDEDATYKRFSGRKIYTSFLQKWPLTRRYHRLFPPLMPLAIEQFDFSRYDVVLSDSSSFSKGIIVPPETLHICYMHTPMRYAWDDCQRYARDFYYPRYVKIFVPFFVNILRLWDKASSKRPDIIIANSHFVSERIKKYYRRTSEVIHPPVATEMFHRGEDKGYFLMVGRLIAYKRHDIVIEAFNRLGLALKIIGLGPEEKRLRMKAKKNIEFLGRVSDEELSHHYAHCKAFIFPQEEDFGIVAMEAFCSGKPIIAFYGGDIVRHMREGKEGIFFYKQDAKSVERAVAAFNEKKFDSRAIQKYAQKFDKYHFQKKIQRYIEEAFKKRGIL